MLVLTVWGHERTKVLGAVVGMAAVSTLADGDRSTSRTPTRRACYFGTDTRASTLLIGAALAFVWAPWRLIAQAPAAARRLVLDAFAAVGLVGVVWFFLNAGEFDPGSTAAGS